MWLAFLKLFSGYVSQYFLPAHFSQTPHLLPTLLLLFGNLKFLAILARPSAPYDDLL
jgi:predicted histidine transporter YuiF (NhaC family)